MSNLDCPRCRHKLESRLEKGVTIDVCPDCKGKWLDAGEVDALVKDHIAVVGGLQQAALINPTATTIPCPRCGPSSRLTKGGFTTPMLIVDKCQKCLGLWFDDRELDLLEKVLAALIAPKR